MKMKKILALLLSFMLILGSVPVALAAGTTVTVEANKNDVKPGDIVTFDLVLTGAEGIRGVEIKLAVSEGLEVTGFEKVTVPANWLGSFSKDNLKIAYAGNAEDAFSGNITLAKLTCTVNEDAEGALTVSVTTCKIADINGDPIDGINAYGATVTVLCDHNWELKDSKESTCSEAGYKLYECSKCHETTKESLEKADHSFEWIVTKAPTCTKDGEKTQICSACGHKGETCVVGATGHDWGSDLTCTICGEEMRVGDNSDVTVKEDGTIVITTTLEDGTVIVTYKFTTGVQVTVTFSPEGEIVSIVINIIARVSDEAVRTGTPVDLRLDEVDVLKDYTGVNLVVTINTNCEQPVPVEFPVVGVKAAHVAMVGETIVPTTKMTETGVAFYCTDGATVKVIDNAKKFSDIKGNNWYNTAVDFVSARDIMTGMTTNTFEAAGATTRAQVWTMLARLAGVDTTCTEGNWYDVARAWAMENGISDGTNANGSITRQELVTMLYRFAGQDGETKSIDTFSDAANVSSWAKAAMEWAYATGVMNGNADGTLNPTGNATRAEMAQFFLNFIQNI